MKIKLLLLVMLVACVTAHAQDKIAAYAAANVLYRQYVLGDDALRSRNDMRKKAAAQEVVDIVYRSTIDIREYLEHMHTVYYNAAQSAYIEALSEEYPMRRGVERFMFCNYTCMFLRYVLRSIDSDR